MAAENPLPLTETTFFILFSLSASPRHGYSIIKEVRRLSDGRITMAAGTLYGAIKRLAELGWIAQVEKNGKEEDDRDRKYYKLTRNGSARLRQEVRRIQELSVLVKDYQPKGGI
ncbi:MAG: helix-turn-helix transcriptional regulator [Anaerolineales bacterium]